MNKLTELRRLLRRPDEEETAESWSQASIFDGSPGATNEQIRVRLRRPIVTGSLVVLFLVVGLLLWAAIASVSGAVLAGGTVKVENNSKEIRRPQGGVISEILVREGQRVRKGQLLMRFSDVQSRAAVDVYRSAADSAAAQVARFQAEAADAPAIGFPPDLMSRASDPAVGQLLASQQGLFFSRMTLYRSQAAVKRAQIQQLRTQISGMQAQGAAIGSQSGLIDDELSGVRELSEQGYAPRSRLLALQRNAAQLKGQRGSIIADMARAQEAIGQTMIELAQLDEKRATEAAEGLRTAQAQLTETVPKLRAAQDELNQAEVRSPVDGYVFNLTQFTEGGATTAAERLLSVVPINSQLIITARVKPNDITDVKVGAPARVTLTAYNPRTTPQIEGKVILVSADATIDEQVKEPYYVVQVQIAPAELAKAGPTVHLTPGMQAQVAIVTGNRTVLDYLLGPLTEAMRSSLRER